MKEIKIYDPTLCCPTGLCGVNIDPELMRIAVVIETLKRKGIKIERFNLRDNPQEYVKNKSVNEFLMKEGAEKLPLIIVDEKIEITGGYPSNEQIAEWLGISADELTVKNNNQNKCCC
jgi:glutaredoxin